MATTVSEGTKRLSPMKRLKRPAENIEYSFRFPPKKIHTYRWFGDIGTDGRLILYNIKGRYYTSMTPQYFTYLIKNRLVEAKETLSFNGTLPEQPIKKPKEQKYIPDHTCVKKPDDSWRYKPQVLDADSKALLVKIRHDMLNITGVRLKYIEEHGQYSVSKLISDIDDVIKAGIVSDYDFGRIISRFYSIDATLSKLPYRLDDSL